MTLESVIINAVRGLRGTRITDVGNLTRKQSLVDLKDFWKNKYDDVTGVREAYRNLKIDNAVRLIQNALEEFETTDKLAILEKATREVVV